VLTTVLLALVSFVSLTGPAQAAPIPIQYLHLEGKGTVMPFSNIVVTWGDSSSIWGYPSETYTGPRGHTYRRFVVYRSGSPGLCLDVRGGASATGAELTTGPCQWSRNSQWWSTDGGTLTPWHAADKDLVATYYVPGGLNPNRLVLAPRVGTSGSSDQRTFKVVNSQIPH
jgi:hypothetical protein